MQLARTIFSDSTTFIEKRRIDNRLLPKSEFSWPKKIKSFGSGSGTGTGTWNESVTVTVTVTGSGSGSG